MNFTPISTLEILPREDPVHLIPFPPYFVNATVDNISSVATDVCFSCEPNFWMYDADRDGPWSRAPACSCAANVNSSSKSEIGMDLFIYIGYYSCQMTISS